jgi:hypothetical protein
MKRVLLDQPDPLANVNFHVLRRAFKESVSQLQLREAHWEDHAKDMVRKASPTGHVDAGLVAWIIRK